MNNRTKYLCLIIVMAAAFVLAGLSLGLGSEVTANADAISMPDTVLIAYDASNAVCSDILYQNNESVFVANNNHSFELTVNAADARTLFDDSNVYVLVGETGYDFVSEGSAYKERSGLYYSPKFTAPTDSEIYFCVDRNGELTKRKINIYEGVIGGSVQGNSLFICGAVALNPAEDIADKWNVRTYANGDIKSISVASAEANVSLPLVIAYNGMGRFDFSYSANLLMLDDSFVISADGEQKVNAIKLGKTCNTENYGGMVDCDFSENGLHVIDFTAVKGVIVANAKDVVTQVTSDYNYYSSSHITIDGFTLVNGASADVTINVLSADANMGNVQFFANGASEAAIGEQTLSYNSQVKATATANTGYTFAYWADAENNVVSRNSAYEFVAVRSVALTANFVSSDTLQKFTSSVYTVNGEEKSAWTEYSLTDTFVPTVYSSSGVPSTKSFVISSISDVPVYIGNAMLSDELVYMEYTFEGDFFYAEIMNGFYKGYVKIYIDDNLVYNYYNGQSYAILSGTAVSGIKSAAWNPIMLPADGNGAHTLRLEYTKCAIMANRTECCLIRNIASYKKENLVSANMISSVDIESLAVYGEVIVRNMYDQTDEAKDVSIAESNYKTVEMVKYLPYFIELPLTYFDERGLKAHYSAETRISVGDGSTDLYCGNAAGYASTDRVVFSVLIVDGDNNFSNYVKNSATGTGTIYASSGFFPIAADFATPDINLSAKSTYRLPTPDVNVNIVQNGNTTFDSSVEIKQEVSVTYGVESMVTISFTDIRDMLRPYLDDENDVYLIFKNNTTNTSLINASILTCEGYSSINGMVNFVFPNLKEDTSFVFWWESDVASFSGSVNFYVNVKVLPPEDFTLSDIITHKVGDISVSQTSGVAFSGHYSEDDLYAVSVTTLTEKIACGIKFELNSKGALTFDARIDGSNNNYLVAKMSPISYNPYPPSGKAVATANDGLILAVGSNNATTTTFNNGSNTFANADQAFTIDGLAYTLTHLLDDQSNPTGWLRISVNIPEAALAEGKATFYLDMVQGLTSNKVVKICVRNFTWTTGGDTVLTTGIRTPEGTSEAVAELLVNNGVSTNSITNLSDAESCVFSVPFAQKVSLSYTANQGYRFYGWIDAANQVLSYEESYSYGQLEDTQVYAVFAPVDYYAAQINGVFYTDIEAAFAAAVTDDIVYLKKNITITEDTVVPQGVSFVVPYNATNAFFATGNTSNASSRLSWNAGVQPTYILTISQDVSLTVNGALTLGAIQHYPDQSAQAHTSGAYSRIVNNGSIIVNGNMDVRGQVVGEGRITVNNGGVLSQPFVVNNYAGGTNTLNHYEAEHFPFTQFATINIECLQTVNYGAKVVGSCSLYFWSAIQLQDIVLIDSYSDSPSGTGALIRIKEGGSLDISYNPNKAVKEVVGNINLTDSGVTAITVHGEAVAGEFSLQGYGSNSMILALPYTYNIAVAADGIFTIPQDRAYKILPGAVVTVEEGGVLNVNGKLFVYDGLIQADKSGKLYPSHATLQANGFSAAGTLYVNGSLNIAATATFAGIAQATETTGIIDIKEGATLSATINEGSTTGYTDDLTVLSLSARVFGYKPEGISAIQAGKRYGAYSKGGFVLASFAMDSASRCASLSAQINQAMTGLFCEILEDGSFAAYSDISIGEGVQGVEIRISGVKYVTDANGVIENAYIKFNSEGKFEYYSEGKQNNVLTADYALNITLTDIIKSAELAADNVYAEIINADGNTAQSLKLNAVLNYYGGATQTVALSGTLASELYIGNVSLSNPVYSVCAFTKAISRSPKSFAEYKATVAALSNTTSAEFVLDATSAYAEYTALLAGRNSEELAFATRELADSIDYFGKVKSISITAAAYGETVINAIGTCFDGTTANVELSYVENTYAYNAGNISASYSYNGVYNTLEYTITESFAAVSKRPLTVSIEDVSMIYGNQAADLVYGIATGTAVDNLEDIVSVVRAEGNNAAEYNITATALSYFYNIQFVYTAVNHSVYTIEARPVTVAIANVSITYGDAEGALSAKVAEGSLNFAGEDTLENTVVLSRQSGTDVGEYTISGACSNTNYNVVFNTDAKYTINIRPTDVTVSSHSDVMVSKSGNIKFNTTRVWDNLPLAGITYKLMQNQEVIAEVAADGTVAVAQGKTYGVGVYSVVPVYQNTNFDITIVGTTVNIIEDNAYYEVSFGFASGAEKTYNGQALVFEPIVKIKETQQALVKNTDYSVTVIKNGKDIVNEIVHYGSYEVNVEIIGENVVYSADFTVNQRKITVSIQGVSSAYGNTLAQLGATVTEGSVLSNETAYSLSCVVSANSVVGEYPIVGKKENNDYDVTFIGADYEVTQREISVTIDNKNTTYGDAFASLTAQTQDALAFDDGLYELIKLERELGNTVGEYAITGTSLNNNYNITFTNSGVYTVDKREIAVTLVSNGSVYGEPEKAIAYLLKEESTLGYTDALADIVSAIRLQGADVGEYAISGVVSNDNYSVSFNADAVYTISARPITVTVDNKTSVYGEEIEAYTANVTTGSVVNGDETPYTLLRDTSLSVGEYSITASSIDQNYALTVVDGKYTITTRPIKLSVADVQSVYGDAFADFAASVSEGSLAYDDVLSDLITVEKAEGSVVGEYKLTATLLQNPDYSATCVFTKDGYSVYTVTPRNITLTVANLSCFNTASWDDVNALLNSSVTEGNICNDDDLGIVYSIILADSDTVLTKENYMQQLRGGVHTIAATTANVNYKVTIVNGELSVSKPKITVKDMVTTYVYNDGADISVFNWRTNLSGYMESATDNSFRAKVFNGQTEVSSNGIVKEVGSYRVEIEIVHTSAYLFDENAVVSYTVTVDKKDISESLVPVGFTDNAKIAFAEDLQFAGSAGEYDAKELDISVTLLFNDIKVKRIAEVGEFDVVLTVNDESYRGSKKFSITIIENVSKKMTELKNKLIALRSLESSASKYIALIDIKGKMLALTENDMLQINADAEYSGILEEIVEIWTAYTQSVQADADIAQKAAGGLAKQIMDAIEQLSIAAYFILKSFGI